MHYCSSQHWTLNYHQIDPQLGVVSTLAQPLHSFWSYFSALLQEHTGHLLTWGVLILIYSSPRLEIDEECMEGQWINRWCYVGRREY